MCFGGIIFLKEQDKRKFVSKYKSLVDKIKCQYCKNFTNCNNKCPELKHYNLSNYHKEEFLNNLKRYLIFSSIINNQNIYPSILNKPKAKGRYLDYVIKIMIKNLLQNLIKEKLIDPDQDLKLIINIDEKSYKSNGYYNLEESIYQELKQGIGNIKDNIHFKNLINGNLVVKIYYTDSSKCYLIQAADLIAGHTRKIAINCNEKDILDKLNYINFLNIFP